MFNTWNPLLYCIHNHNVIQNKLNEFLCRSFIRKKDIIKWEYFCNCNFNTYLIKGSVYKNKDKNKINNKYLIT